MKFYNLEELRDSRLLYDKNPPKYMYVVIALTFLLLVSAVIVSIFIHKPYVVKSSGIVSLNTKSQLMANVSGTIITTNLKEGLSVKKGDNLLSFDDIQTKTQVQQSSDMINNYSEQIKLYDRCIKELQNGTNTFKQTSPEELTFYNQIKLTKSKMAQYDIPDSQYKEIGYTDEQIKAAQKQNAQQKSSVIYQAISDMDTQRTQLVQAMKTAQTQHDEYSRLLDSYTLQAPQSGIVHLNATVSPGMTLQAGTVLGTISGNDESGIELETYIQSYDRAKVKVGDPVEICISGVSQNDYGVLTGKIISIDSDATINQEKGNVSFKATIKPDLFELKGKNNDSIKLTPGMVVEARIKYKDTTWFNWILDQIGIRIN